MIIVRKLIVDEFNEIFDARGMKYKEYPSYFDRIRDYTKDILKEAPDEFLEGSLLEQQLSEIIKNGIKHGNKCDPRKMLRVWYDLRTKVRFIVEDEGAGFKNLEDWNEFYRKRQTALFNNQFDKFLELAGYRHKNSDADDGGNSLVAAMEYWNGGIVYNKKKCKIGVIRWFASSSASRAEQKNIYANSY